MKAHGALPVRGVGAHRGGAAHQPENTLAAFRAAVARGVHMVELDCRASADGEVLVIHDETVDRTTDGSGAVADLSLAALRKLDASVSFGREQIQGRIPSLAEVLEVVPTDVWLNVQIKYQEPVVADVLRLLAESGHGAHAFLACGNAAGREAQALHPGIRISNLVRQRSRAAYLDHAIATGSSFIQLHYLRGPAEPPLVARAHERGLKVIYYCAPGASDAEIDGVFSAGADFALLDDLDRGLAAAARAGIAPLAR